MNNKIIVEQYNEFITILKFNNPPIHTMTAESVKELCYFLGHLKKNIAEGNSSLRVLMLTGAEAAQKANIFIRSYDVSELSASSLGQKITTSKNNMDEYPPVPQEYRVQGLDGCLKCMEALPLITVAAINGLAMGGGMELTLGCDFRLISASSNGYGLPETSVGILPGGGGTQRLARMLGTAKALDFILHAKLMKPAQALELGVVHRVYPANTFYADALDFCIDLSNRAPVALAASKICIQQGTQLSLSDGLKLESIEFGKTMRSDDAKRAMKTVAQSYGKDTSLGKYKNAKDPGFEWDSKYPPNSKL